MSARDVPLDTGTPDGAESGMSKRRNWTAVGLGVEVLAGMAILISPWLAIPIALGGAGIIAWGLYPDKIERVISKVLCRWVAESRGELEQRIITAELETTVPRIGDFTPVCSIRIINTGPPLESKCLVKVEKHGLEIHMPDPLVVRTHGQIQNDRTGPFTLRTGEPKLVPILFRHPGRINEFRFIGEDKNHYDFSGDSAEFEVAIYGAEHPTRVCIRLDVGEDWKVHTEMEYC